MTYDEMTQEQRLVLYRAMQAFIKSAAKLEYSNTVVPVTVPVLFGTEWVDVDYLLGVIGDIVGTGAVPANVVVHNGDIITSGE